MGQHEVARERNDAAMHRFARSLLRDVRALELMLENDMFETGIRRIGAEQEMFLVDEHWKPAPIGDRIIRQNPEANLVTELARFNLEANLPPQVFGDACLSELEETLLRTMRVVKECAAEHGARAVLCGILPTIHISDLTLDNLTPAARYYELNETIKRLRGEGIYQIRGVDELMVRHNSIIIEGCNTSFQIHFQLTPDEFARLYNIAQLIAAPVLAVACNSPILFGKRLWRETRIALFQQALDTRSGNLYLRELSPRVHFGTDWVKESVTELFKEDIARFRILLAADELEDSMQTLEEGRIPRLQALQLHNGTVYRWNRACYGITNGKPHLRIENRILPAGPTVADQVANAAFWFGLISGLAAETTDIRQHIDFDDAKSNFVAAAGQGLASQMVWLGGERYPAHELILTELLPLARRGLAASGIRSEDADRYLGIIEERTKTRKTGAQWQLLSLARMKGIGTRMERLSALVASMIEHQDENAPVHTWTLSRVPEQPHPFRLSDARVEYYMMTDLFTVDENELVELVASLMTWRRLQHVLIENEHHRLVGLVTHRSVLRYLSEHKAKSPEEIDTTVKDIMVRNLITVSPETSMLDAYLLMREHRISSLPVLRDEQLVGILTDREFMHLAGRILDITNHAARTDDDPRGLHPSPSLRTPSVA